MLWTCSAFTMEILQQLILQNFCFGMKISMLCGQKSLALTQAHTSSLISVDVYSLSHTQRAIADLLEMIASNFCYTWLFSVQVDVAFWPCRRVMAMLTAGIESYFNGTENTEILNSNLNFCAHWFSYIFCQLPPHKRASKHVRVVCGASCTHWNTHTLSVATIL